MTERKRVDISLSEFLRDHLGEVAFRPYHVQQMADEQFKEGKPLTITTDEHNYVISPDPPTNPTPIAEETVVEEIEPEASEVKPEADMVHAPIKLVRKGRPKKVEPVSEK